MVHLSIEFVRLVDVVGVTFDLVEEGSPDREPCDEILVGGHRGIGEHLCRPSISQPRAAVLPGFFIDRMVRRVEAVLAFCEAVAALGRSVEVYGGLAAAAAAAVLRCPGRTGVGRGPPG